MTRAGASEVRCSLSDRYPGLRGAKFLGPGGCSPGLAARAGPFIPINCGAIPRELLESELFGYEKGSFTGAYRSSIGTVERAHKGTLFLDEVGELPFELQVKLLIHTGRFREDLYYRLDVVNLALPPLKDRGEDVLIIAKFFLKHYAAQQTKNILKFSPEALTAIQMHPWQGNIRELINRIRRAVVMADSAWIMPEHMSLKINEINPEPFIDGMGLREAKQKLEVDLVSAALQKYQWNVRLTAKALKTSRSVIYNLMEKYKISPQSQQRPADFRLVSRSVLPKSS
jgi:two-component system NtrC family response regulator